VTYFLAIFLAVVGSQPSTVPQQVTSTLSQPSISKAEDVATYSSLYGEREKTVNGTAGRDDDLAFARVLLQAAKETSASPGLQAVLLWKAYSEAASLPQDFQVALEALDTLAVVSASDAPRVQAEAVDMLLRIAEGSSDSTQRAASEAMPRLTKLAEESFKAGRLDDARAAISRARAMSPRVSGSAKVIAQLRTLSLRIAEARVKELELKDPAALSTTEAEEAAMLLMFELNKPLSAAAFADTAANTELATLARLAGREKKDLTPPETLALATGLEACAGKAGPAYRDACLRKSLDAYTLFLNKHTTPDAERLKGTVGRDRVAAALNTVVSQEGDPTLFPAKFFGLEAPGRRFAFVVDVSGSMDGQKLDRLKKELSTAIGSFSDRASFVILPFESSFKPLGKDVKLVQGTAGNKKAALEAIKTLRAGGGTEPMPALQAALSLKPRPDVIFFMTDGLFDAGVVEQLTAEIKTGEPVKIYCITFIDRSSESIMRRIVQATGGEYKHIDGR
jgi:hypothetical protein